MDEPVTLRAYDPHWPTRYESEAALLRAELTAAVLGIEHIGSTAVPGLEAKPIVDIMVGVRAMEVSQHVVDRLEQLGYEDGGGIADRRYLRKRGFGGDVNVQVLEYDGALWRANVLFRDHLRTNADARERYAAAKRAALARAPMLFAYSSLKERVIEELKREASMAAVATVNRSGPQSRMLEPGFSVTSPRGTVVDIVENTPERFVIKRILPPRTGKTPPHRHDNGVERFRIIEGEATGAVGRRSRVLRDGDVMEVPMGATHVHPHTDGATIATIEHTIEPRPRFVPVFFASWLTWLGDGRVDKQDEPTLLGVMAVLKEGGGGTWVAGIPVGAQRLLASVLAPVANARGLHAVVPPEV